LDEDELDHCICRVWSSLAASGQEDEADWSNRLLLIANITSLEIQVTSLLTPYATSAFQAHSLVSTIAVVQNVVSCMYHS
jgi:hypothetical protein